MEREPDVVGTLLGWFDNINEPRLEYLYWLGMPIDKRLVLLRVPGTSIDPAATGFTIDHVGLRTDERESKTGFVITTEMNALPLHVEVWLIRARCAGTPVAYEEIFDVGLGIWHSSITFLEALPQNERAKAVSQITPGIALVSRVGQQVNFREEQGYGGFTREELTINNIDTIERMAQKQKSSRDIKPFTVDDFRKNYPKRMSRSAIYNYVKRHEFLDLERRYVERCRELRGEA